MYSQSQVAPLVAASHAPRAATDVQLLTLAPKAVSGAQPSKEIAIQLFNHLRDLGYADKDIVLLSSELIGMLALNIKQREATRS